VLRVKQLGLTLITVAIVTTMTAASALAEPEFSPSTKQKITGSSKTSSISSSAGTLITCPNDTSTGEVSGSTTLGNVIVTFTGCTGKEGGKECTVKSVSAKNAGEIVMHTLKGTLGLVSSSEAPSGVGLLLEPTTGKVWSTVEKTSCTIETAVEGSLAGEVGPINEGKEGELAFTGNVGSQSIKKITVGGVEHKPQLTAFGTTVSDSRTEGILFEKSVEIAAVFSGPSWWFEGARLGAGEKAVMIGGTTIKIKSINGEVKLECTGASGSGDIIGSAARAVGTDQHKLTLTGCVDKAEEGKCEIVSFHNEETEANPAGQIGPITVKTELVFPGNTKQRRIAGDLFLPAEKNGAKESVFVVIELKNKGGEVCAAKGKYDMEAGPEGGPVAKLEIMGATANSGVGTEELQLTFPATQFKNVEQWTGLRYSQAAIEFQWFNRTTAILSTLEIEGKIVLTMAGKKFGWLAR
jgi:hypothetical protein